MQGSSTFQLGSQADLSPPVPTSCHIACSPRQALHAVLVYRSLRPDSSQCAAMPFPPTTLETTAQERPRAIYPTTGEPATQRRWLPISSSACPGAWPDESESKEC